MESADPDLGLTDAPPEHYSGNTAVVVVWLIWRRDDDGGLDTTPPSHPTTALLLATGFIGMVVDVGRAGNFSTFNVLMDWIGI